MIEIGYLVLENPIAVISTYGPGNSNGNSNSNGSSPGLLLLEGFDLDEVSAGDIEAALEDLKVPVRGFSVTGSDTGRLMEAAELAVRKRYLLEMDLRGYDKLYPDSLGAMVRKIKESGTALSLRFVPEALSKELIRTLKDDGLDLIHLDLSGANGKVRKMIKQISDARGRNGPMLMVQGRVGDFDAAKNILSMGAELVALASPDPEFADWLSQTMVEYGRLIGWYNAPKHICAGGDLRGLSFCCPPVKGCPVLGALKKAGITPKEFVEKKLKLAEGTPLQYGDGTCFGSLVWCCKITKPCFMRDAALHRIGLSGSEYMALKRRLAEGLLSS